MSQSITRRQPRSFRLAIVAILIGLLAVAIPASQARADIGDSPEPTLGFDPVTGFVWNDKVGSVYFATWDKDPTCESKPGYADGYSQQHIWVQQPLADRELQFDAWYDDPDLSPHSPFTLAAGQQNNSWPIGRAGQGTHTGHITWTDLDGVKYEYVWTFTVTVCDLAAEENVSRRTPDTLAGEAGNGAIYVQLYPGSEAHDTDVAYTVYVEGQKAASKTVSSRQGSSVELKLDGLNATDSDTAIVVEYPGQASPASFPIEQIKYAATSGSQLAPKASISGTAKVIRNPVARSLCVTNTPDPTKRTNSYTGTLTGPVTKKFSVSELKDGAKGCKSYDLPAGSYTLSFKGPDGTSSALKFTVSAYPAPTYKVTDKAKGLVKVCSAWPTSTYTITWEDGDSKGKKFGRNHTGKPKSSCTTLNTYNVANHTVNYVRVTLSVAGPNVVWKVKIDRR